MRGRDVYGPLSSRVAARRVRSFPPHLDVDEHVGDTGHVRQVGSSTSPRLLRVPPVHGTSSRRPPRGDEHTGHTARAGKTAGGGPGAGGSGGSTASDRCAPRSPARRSRARRDSECGVSDADRSAQLHVRQPCGQRLVVDAGRGDQLVPRLDPCDLRQRQTQRHRLDRLRCPGGHGVSGGRSGAEADVATRPGRLSGSHDRNYAGRAESGATPVRGSAAASRR